MAKSYAELKEEEQTFGEALIQVPAQEDTLRELVSLLKHGGYNISNVKQFVMSIGTSVTQLPDFECMVAIIKNDDDSSGNIYIGDSSVSTTNGFKLTPGSGIVVSPKNLNIFYVVSDSTAVLDILAVW